MDEASNLTKLFEGINRAEFARTYKVPGGDSMIYQHMTGRKPISLDAAVCYAIGFKRPLADISPRLAGIIDRLPKQNTGTYAITEPEPHPYHTNVVAMPIDSPLKAELAGIIGKINERGMILLIDQAEQIAARFPRAKANLAR